MFQIERAGQWVKGKGCETFGPLGPWLVTKDEIKDPQGLDMWLDVNGEKRQRGNTKTMIFDCRHLVWYCSQYFVLEPGDVIITGTPPGVGLGMKPEPKFLKAGDVVTLGIDGLGRAAAEGGEVQEVRCACAAPNASGLRCLTTRRGNDARARGPMPILIRFAAAERSRHVGLGRAHRLGERQSLGKAGRDRRGQRAAGAMGVLRSRCGRLRGA